jgi:hypothetical protein
VLLADAPLTFREFMTNEALPLASIFRAIFTFLTTRSDVVLFGAHAVNAYCEPERMTPRVDLMSTNAAELADTLCTQLAATFHIAVRVREVTPGVGYRIYQVQKPKNRHLVDLRQVAELPPHEPREGVMTTAPLELVVMKTISMADRRAREKGLSDRLDLHRLLHAFPALKADEGPVMARLREVAAPEAALIAWREIVRERLEPDDDSDDDLDA